MDRLSGRVLLVIAGVACLVFLAIGVLIGWFSRQPPPAPLPPPASQAPPSQFWSRRPDLQAFQTQCEASVKKAEDCSVSLPRHYVAYKLASGQSINIDGRLDDPAWEEVPWTEDFSDIRGLEYPVAKATRAKVRYDSEFLYVGAWLQEDKPWATYAEKDTRIYQENAFEVFLDVDRSMSMYKEVEINVINTTWDLMLDRAYIDGGNWFDWEGIAAKNVYTDGRPNHVNPPASYWSLEFAFPFSDLNQNTSRSHLQPTDGEMWFMILARPQYEVEALPNMTYARKPGTDASWYAWNPIGAINLHLPSRWGLLFFKEGAPSMNPSITYPNWLIYQALFDIFEAEKAFHGVFGTYTDSMDKLKLPPYVTSGCLYAVRVTLTGDDGFEASVTSLSRVEGRIRQDRYTWFP